MRATAFVLAALVALLAPAAASAQLTAIDGSPLDVYTDGIGGIQIMVDGDPNGVFYNPSSVSFGAAGHAGLEAVVNNTAIPLGTGRLNTVPPQVSQITPDIRIVESQYELSIGASKQLLVKETLEHVNGAIVVPAIYEITNINQTALTDVRMGVLGDLYSGGDDAGSGELTGEPPSRFLMGVNPTTGARTGLIEVEEWSAYQEGLYADVFASFQGAGLTSTIDPAVVDNGVGVQWNLGAMAPAEVRTVSVGWLVQRGTAPPPPAPPPLAPPTPPPTLTPDLGKSVLAVTSKGKVRVKLPGSNEYVDLTSLQELPLGTVFDTSKGQVTLTSAADAAGATQKAWFYEGIFKIGQTKGAKPITTLALAGPKPSCKRASKRSRASARRAKSRRLWGDGKGRFQTKGQFSSATVRGTKWLVQDRCDGTLTRVVNGSVTVRDLVKRKNVIVKAGRSYLARKRR